MKLSEIAEKLGCKLEGDANAEIRAVAGIEDAGPGDLTFLANLKYRPALETTRASAILIASDAGPVRIAALRSANPYLDFARAIELFHPAPKFPAAVHPTAVIAKSAKIGTGAHIGPYCFVDEDVEIGRNAVLHSFVAIYRGAKIGDDFFAHSHCAVRESCRIGHRVLLQNGVVIGSDGFGFARQSNGTWYKMRSSAMTSKSRPKVQSIAPRSAKLKSAAARNSTTWFRSATPQKSVKILCCAARWVSRAPLALATSAFSRGRSALRDISRLATAPR